MYSWGGSTKEWKKPGGYKFDSARAPYLDSLAAASKAKGGRHYSTRSSPDLKLVDPKGKTITSDSLNAIIFGIDVTGSMSEWPREIFDRLPLFYQTLSQYRPDLEVSFAAIGDASCDNYPLQVNNFGKGVSLEEHVKALYPEGGGGGQVSESYEMFGYFVLAHAKLPKAVSPFLFICGDEKFYNAVDPAQVEHYIGDKLQGPLDSKLVLEKLMQKYDIFYLHKPYGSGGDEDTTAEVREHWARAIGPQRVIALPSYDRVVDIAMGIVAKKWGQFGDFKDNLSARQTDPNVVDGVYRSLRFITEDGSTGSVRNKTLPPGKTISLKKLPPGKA
ncbi:MAG: hypothetical protein V1702_04985 [Candidatus Woesearchaeota archaeon]